MFWGINGRRTVSFNPARNASYKAIARRVFTFASIFLWLCVWVFPSQALAEFDDGDSSNLNTIRVMTSSMETRQEWMFDYLVGALGGNMNSGAETPYYVPAIYNQLQQLYKSLGTTEQNTLLSKLTTLEGYSSSLVNNSEDSLDHLQRIEDFLSNIEALLESNSGGSGSGGEGSTEENDWVKETTFQEYSDNFQMYSDNFQTYYDWMRSALGYTGGSTGTLKSDLNSFFNKDEYLSHYLWTVESPFDQKAPFPGNNYKWNVSSWSEDYVPVYYNSPWEFIVCELQRSIFDTKDTAFNIAVKQAWNDWQAHTNLVSTLERLLDYQPPENRVDSTSDIGTITQSQNGGEVLNITYESGTGDSPETIDLNPAYTNNVAQLSTDADDIKKDFDDIWDYDKIKERYVDSEKFNNTSSFQDVQQQEVSNYTIQYGNKPYMQFRWSGTALRMYKAIFTYDRMRLLRSTFGRMWNLLVIWGCYVLFRILGKANA